MGQTSSSLAQKITKPFSWLSGGHDRNQSFVSNSELSRYQGVTPFIFKRSSSMYFDEDGDLAHEFYEEVRKGRKSAMKRRYKNLTPQGEIDLVIPRLNNELPIIMCEAPLKS